MEKRTLMVFLMLVISPLVFIANAWTVRSPIIGTAASLVFLSVASWVTGELLFSREDRVFRVTFGFITVLIFLALTGNVLIVIASFTETVSLIAIAVLGVILGLAFARFRQSHSPQVTSKSRVSYGKKVAGETILLMIPFLASAVIAFWLLWLGRTGEGGASVWLTIPSFFISLFLFVSFSLMVVLVFTRLSNSLKLGLVCVFSFLVHSLFLLVWYPGRYGDPWVHLGEARYIARTGIPYAYSWMVKQFLILELTLRAQEALTVFFGRMFLMDLYWVHVVLVPLLWSTLVPLIAYRIAEMLVVKKSGIFPILTAVATVLFPSLILWGTVSVPNSLGFIFFFVSIMFSLSWMNHGGKHKWLLSLLASIVSFLAHPQTGLFGFMLLFWTTVIHRTTRKIWSFMSYVPIFLVYPLTLLYVQASFSVKNLLFLDSFLSFQSEISTIMLVFGVVGLILGVKDRLVSTRGVLVIFIFYATILTEYYVTRFGMTNIPYGAGRVLAMADFLLVPFVALGFFMIAKTFGKSSSLKSQIGSSFKRLRTGLSRRFVSLFLICLFLSLQTTVVLYQAYPHNEIVKVQPSDYELEAIQYMDSDAPGRYVVLCEPTFAGLAIGTLGADHGYIGSGRGAFGIPELWYYLAQMWLSMTKQPSTGIMKEAMNIANATVGYFVVSIRSSEFESIIQRTTAAFGRPDKDFGYGKLYLWRHPLPIYEEPGRYVKVAFEDGNFTYNQTKFVYMIESEINSTLALSGHVSYYITEYPLNWTFLDLTVNNMTAKFDESSDVNSFIYINGLSPNDTVAVTWLSNRNYPFVGWKDDSFKTGWETHWLYPGNIEPTIVSDGNILSLSHYFTPGSYEYYYYVKPVNVSTDEYNYVMIRWKSNGPIAVAAVYFELEVVQYVVELGSQSGGWATTIVKMPPGDSITNVMVGISDARAPSLLGFRTLQIDYILIVAETSS